MKNKIRMTMILCLIAVLLSGCWDSEELTNLAIITGEAIDITEDGKIEANFQAVNPANLASSLQGGGSAEGTYITIYSGEGDNISQARSAASKKIARELYLSHTNLVAFSEDVVNDTRFLQILEGMDRDIQFRTTTELIITRDTKAVDLLGIVTPGAQVPARKIIKGIETTYEGTGEVIVVSVQDFISCLVNPGKQPVIPVIKVTGDIEKGKKIENLDKTIPYASIEVDGLALFKDNQIVEWFTKRDAVGVIWVLDKLKQTVVSTDWEGTPSALSYNVTKSNTDVEVIKKDETLQAKVKVDAKGYLLSIDKPVDLREHNTIHKMETVIEAEIKDIIEQSIRKAKEKKTDVFGFGEEIYRTYPKEWEKIKGNWNDDDFPELEVSVEVKAEIDRTGLRTNPFLYQKKKNHEE